MLIAFAYFCVDKYFDRLLLEVSYISKEAHQINEEITDIEVRLIGEDGTQLGIMSAEAALEAAAEAGLDLVKIAPGSKPPVCRIMD